MLRKPIYYLITPPYIMESWNRMLYAQTQNLNLTQRHDTFVFLCSLLPRPPFQLQVNIPHNILSCSIIWSKPPTMYPKSKLLMCPNSLLEIIVQKYSLTSPNPRTIQNLKSQKKIKYNPKRQRRKRKKRPSTCLVCGLPLIHNIYIMVCSFGRKK